MAKLEVSGLKELIDKLERIPRQLGEASYASATGQAVRYVLSKVPKYPAPPPGSKYKRTGTLGRSITGRVEPLGSQTVGKIGTPTVYSPFVISSKDQARQHQGRWWTLQKVIEDNLSGIRDIYRKALNKLLRG